MSPKGEILEVIPQIDIPKLRDFYKQHLPYASYVYNFLETVLKWQKLAPKKHFFTFFAPNGDWRSDGTFITLIEYHCYNLFMFTLDKKCTRLCEALMETNRIDFVNNHILLYGLHNDHRPAVLRVMESKNVPVWYHRKTGLWWLPYEKAAKFEIECPDNYYVAKLKPEHSSIINPIWPLRYEGSEMFIRTQIEMGGGHGVFQKSDDALVCWVLKNELGILGALQTLEGHKRLGLGSIVTKSLSKEIGLDGHDAMGTVIEFNTASQTMFKKLGFEILDNLGFIGIGSKRIWP